MPARNLILYRADSATEPFFGFGSCWAQSLDHAVQYTRRPGFGGPYLYATSVGVHAEEILDLTDDPVNKMLCEFRIDLRSQGEGEWLPREIIRCAKQRGPNRGHRFWLYDVDEPGITWVYLGAPPLPTGRVIEGEAWWPACDSDASF